MEKRELRRLQEKARWPERRAEVSGGFSQDPGET